MCDTESIGDTVSGKNPPLYLYAYIIIDLQVHQNRGESPG